MSQADVDNTIGGRNAGPVRASSDARGGHVRLLTALVAATAVASVPAAAVTLKQKGVLTPIELKQCKKGPPVPDGARWTCKGLKNFPVYIADGDLRTFVSVGRDAAKRRAAEQTLGPFNTIFKDKTSRALLEWRTAGGGPAGEPRAVIVHYFTNRDGKRGEVLAVLKVTTKETCHAAYVDHMTNAEAITLARRFADEDAPRFDCAKEPVVLGQPGELTR